MPNENPNESLLDFSDDELPRCRYCGRSILPPKDMTAEEAIEYATMKCDCARAVEYQEAEKKKADRGENIKRINGSLEAFETYCLAHGTELTADIKAHLHSSAVLVLDDVLNAAAIAVDRIKAKINKNAKGNVVINFSYSDSGKSEV